MSWRSQSWVNERHRLDQSIAGAVLNGIPGDSECSATSCVFEVASISIRAIASALHPDSDAACAKHSPPETLVLAEYSAVVCTCSLPEHAIPSPAAEDSRKPVRTVAEHTPSSITRSPVISAQHPNSRVVGISYRLSKDADAVIRAVAAENPKCFSRFNVQRRTRGDRADANLPVRFDYHLGAIRSGSELQIVIGHRRENATGGVRSQQHFMRTIPRLYVYVSTSAAQHREVAVSIGGSYAHIPSRL